ncbi:MAG TPA: hypothetical protein PKK12_02685 [Candidatus Aminicenantes bacterium]|nr:hypothetical protein [Candidatus Aminicenantes bacterium]
MRRRTALYALLGIGLAAFLSLWVIIPLQPLVAMVYGGLVLTGFGLLNLIRPWQIFGIASRPRALYLLAGGLLLVAGGLNWPPREIRAEPVRQRLDLFLPLYSFWEHHEVRVAAPSGLVMRAARQVSLADLPLARVLLRLRQGFGWAGEYREKGLRRPLLEICSDPAHGFLTLEATRSDEYVGGLAGRPWSSAPPPPVRTPAQFRAFAAPGHIRVAFNMRCQAADARHTVLSTDTRIQGNDAAANRTFARYWRLIYPGSALIRKAWLSAIATRAEELDRAEAAGSARPPR